MNINEFISILPASIIKGKDIKISDDVFRDLFQFSKLHNRDNFYYLNFGSNNYNVIKISKEFQVKCTTLIEINDLPSLKDKQIPKDVKDSSKIIYSNINSINIEESSDLFYLTMNENHIDILIKKFEEQLKPGSKIITIFSPPGMIIPDEVDFPFIVCKKPFKYANTIEEQIEKIYGNKCIDFTASWFLAEKYIEKLKATPGEYFRFVNMLMSMIIWINAWNLNVSCEKEIPPPVQTYIGILKHFFNLDLTKMIKESK
ncbi:MAG: hypothetical protein ACPKPY_00085 [Nitrososphaeraceae archaeon]